MDNAMSLIITKNVYLMEEIVKTLLGHGLDRDKDKSWLEKNPRLFNNFEWSDEDASEASIRVV